MGTLDLSAPESATLALLKRLRGGRSDKAPAADQGARKMAMLRRLPRILRFIPGKAQDLRAWFLAMQDWLGSSDDNVEAMVRALLGGYCRFAGWRGGAARRRSTIPTWGSTSLTCPAGSPPPRPGCRRHASRWRRSAC